MLSVADLDQLRLIKEGCTCIETLNAKYQLLINVTSQYLHLFTSSVCTNSYRVSTALNGIGQIEGSGKTPLGLHQVIEKHGHDAAPFEIFRSRVSTGLHAKLDTGKDEIVGRILRLQGLEPGLNQGLDAFGNSVDTYNRYIYIHGTNNISDLGKPVSLGCIRMHPEDVIDLFDQVPLHALVMIYHENR